MKATLSYNEYAQLPIMVSTVYQSEMNAMPLGSNIRYYRNKRGLTQGQLAKMCKTSRPAVTQWETDKTRPSTENLILIAKAVGVEITDLYADEVAGTVAESGPSYLAKASHLELSERKQELLALFEQLTPKRQRALLEHLKAFSEE